MCCEGRHSAGAAGLALLPVPIPGPREGALSFHHLLAAICLLRAASLGYRQGALMFLGVGRAGLCCALQPGHTSASALSVAAAVTLDGGPSAAVCSRVLSQELFQDPPCICCSGTLEFQ